MVRLTIEELEQISDLKITFSEKNASKISELYALSLQQLRLKAMTDRRTEIIQIQHKINALNAYLAVGQLALEFDMFDALSEPAKKSMQMHWLSTVSLSAAATAVGPPFHSDFSSACVSPLCKPPPLNIHCRDCKFSRIADAHDTDGAHDCSLDRALPHGIQ